MNTKELAPNTVKMYKISSDRLKTHVNIHDRTALKNYLDTLKPTYALVYLKSIAREVSVGDLIDHYNRIDMNTDKEVEMTGDSSDLLTAIQHYKFADKKTNEDWMKYLIVLLYNEYPLRNDLVEIKVRNYDPSKDNYINSQNLVLNKYKTAKVYGPATLKLTQEISSVLDKYLQKHNNDYLFITKKGLPFNQVQMTNYIKRIYNVAVGKPINIWSIRKIKIAEDQKKVGSVEELFKLSGKYGHRVDTQLKYYTKK